MDAFIAGAWRSPNRGEVQVGGTWRRLTRAEAYIAGQWRTAVTFILPLAATANPNSVAGYGSARKPTQVASGFTTATPSGGLGPYSYSWAIISGDPVTISTPTSATTNFRGANANSVARCTVTDSLGSTATCDVSVTLVFELEL